MQLSATYANQANLETPQKTVFIFVVTLVLQKWRRSRWDGERVDVPAKRNQDFNLKLCLESHVIYERDSPEDPERDTQQSFSPLQQRPNQILLHLDWP